MESLCFTEDTLISTSDGMKRIKDIKIGDKVYSENPETGEKGLKRVKRVTDIFVNESKALTHVFAGSEEIKATPSHPFWVVGKGWVEAGTLEVGDQLLLYDGKELVVTALTDEVFEKPIKVYNFEVEDWHSYFVSNVNVLVHNMCAQNGRIFNISRQESSVWNGLDNVKGMNRKMSGIGKERKYFEWDNTHNDIEVYNAKGKHLGSMDPTTGEMYKDPVTGRTIKIN